MTLPALDIPFTLALPFEIPLLVHPIAVHFAIALPVIILLIELSNLLFKSSVEIDNIAFKRRAMSVTSLFLTLLLVVIYFAAFFTGKVDGSESGPLLSSAGQAELKEHKLIGTYLVYASIILAAMKAFSMLVSRGWAKSLFIILLIGFIAGSMRQGKDGGELVYEYGANVKLVSTQEDTIDDLKDEMDEFTQELEELEALKAAHAAELEALHGKLDELKEVSGATLEAVEEVEQSVKKDLSSEAPQDAVGKAVAETVALPGAEIELSTTEVNATH